MDHAGRENWWLKGASNRNDQLQHFIGHLVRVLSSLSALPPLGQGLLPLENPGEEVALEGCALFA